MRITSITTVDQQSAIATAAIAANLLHERFNGEAALAEVGAENNLDYGYTQYQLLNVWGPGEDHAEQFNTRPHLWCFEESEGPQHTLTADDVARIQTVLKAAGDLDCNIFGICDLATGVFDLDIAAVLKMAAGDEASKLAKQIAELGMSAVDLDDLVEHAACPPDGQPAEVPEHVLEGGVDEAAAFLVEKLGYAEALAAVKQHHLA